MKFDYKKLVGFGILIWVVAFAIASAFVAYNAIDTLIAKITVPVVVGIVTFFAGKNLKLKEPKEAVRYSIVWVVIGILLDTIFTVPFTGWGIFMQWNVWLSYILVFTLPPAVTKLK